MNTSVSRRSLRGRALYLADTLDRATDAGPVQMRNAVFAVALCLTMLAEDVADQPAATAPTPLMAAPHAVVTRWESALRTSVESADDEQLRADAAEAAVRLRAVAEHMPDRGPVIPRVRLHPEEETSNHEH